MYLIFIMVKGLSTILCQVASVERAAEFYQGVLGLIPVYVSSSWGQFNLPGGGSIGLHPPFHGGSPSNGSGWILGIEVDEIASLRHTLEEAGHSEGGYHDVPGGVILDFTDVDGNPIQAMQVGISVKELV